jgi:Protein of unknown function (DUF2786)
MTEDAKRLAMIERVQKLWALADHPNTGEAERDNAVAQAKNLMAKYQIDEIVLSSSKGVDEDVVLASFRCTRFDDAGKEIGMVPRQRVVLAHFIGLNNRCRSIVEKKHMTVDQVTGKEIPGGTFLTVVGFKSDVDWVRDLYTTLSVDMLEQLMSEPVIVTKGYVAGTENFAKNFAMGYADRINERLGDIARQVERGLGSEKSTALVLVDRSAKVEDRVELLFPSAARGGYNAAAGTKHDGNAQARGRRAANVADLSHGGKGVGSGSGKAIGSR